MKKKAALLMITILAAGAIAACGSSGSSGASGQAASTSESTEAASTEAAAATEAAEPAGDPIRLILGHTNAETDSRHTMVLKFADLVNEKTNGQVTVECHGGGELGNGQQEIEGLRMKTQDILVEGYALLGMYTEYGMDSLPYLYKDYDHFMKCWYDSPVGAKWIEYAADADYTVFGPSYRGFRNVTSMKSFTNVDEVAGLKIRTPSSEPFVSTWNYLNTQATPMDLAEVITGLQQGTIEAQENPLLLSYTYGFADVCKYLIMTKHSCGADIFMMDTARFNELPENVQTAIVEAAEEAAKEVSASNAQEEDGYIDKFREKGVEVIEPDLESFRGKFANFVPEKFPHMQEIADMIAAVE